MKFCSVENCDSAARTAGLCPMHYTREKYGHVPLVADTSEMPRCSVSHCHLTAGTRRTQIPLCAPHFQKVHRGFDPEDYVISPGGYVDRKCWVESCPKRVNAKGLCNYHGRKARAGVLKVPDELGVVLNPPCSFEGCDKLQITKKLCHSHYEQLRTTGKTQPLQDYGKYVKGEHVCAVEICTRAAVSQNACDRHLRMVKEYKVSVDRLSEIWSDPICENPGCGSTFRLHMDHDHETGLFRGLLCQSCNTSLGRLGEDVDRIRGLATYKELHS